MKCTICNDEINDKTGLVRLSCAHSFHLLCAKRDIGMKCPTCDSGLTEYEYNTNIDYYSMTDEMELKVDTELCEALDYDNLMCHYNYPTVSKFTELVDDLGINQQQVQFWSLAFSDALNSTSSSHYTIFNTGGVISRLADHLDQSDIDESTLNMVLSAALTSLCDLTLDM